MRNRTDLSHDSHTESSIYHDTWRLLKKYRDITWSLEMSVRQAQGNDRVEYVRIEDFLHTVYQTGVYSTDHDLWRHARNIERSYKMLRLIETAIELLRTKHKSGESLYWVLYFTFMTPQKLQNTEEIIEKLRPHVRDISIPTYYRKRQEAISVLSSILWGYTSRDCLDILDQLVPSQ